MPASKQVKKTTTRGSGISLRVVTREFWSGVGQRLVQVHRIRPHAAKHAMVVYRRRVGNVAMNQGPVETAQDIASVVRAGGFPPIRRKSVASVGNLSVET